MSLLSPIRAVDNRDIENARKLIVQIGISGLLIAAADACEDIAKEYQYKKNDKQLADTWWDNNSACVVASETVSDEF